MSLEVTGLKPIKACASCERSVGVEFRGNRTMCRDCERARSRSRSFRIARGISHEDRDALLEAQGFACAACGSSEAGSKKGWHVDHCHRNQTIRGVLCATCNIALGQVNDSTTRLQKLIDYIERHQ